MDGPAGWHHMSGDPPGTVRAWTGQDWSGEPQVITHEPLATRAQLATAGLALIVLANLAMIFLLGRDIDRLNDWDPANYVRADLRRAADIAQQIETADTVNLVLTLLTGIAFLAWFARAYANVRWLRGQTRRSPGMAVAGWLIPIVNLYAPLMMTKELRPFTTSDRSANHVPLRLLYLWWSLYLGSMLGGLALLAVQTTTVSGGVRLNLATIALIVADCAAALLAIIIVRRITSYQDSRLAEPPSAPSILGF